MNCIIDALTTMNNTVEPRTGAGKDKAPAFADFFERVASAPGARTAKSARDKTPRIEPLRQFASKPAEPKAEKPRKNSEPVIDETRDADETDDRRTRAELNREIVETLSGMMSVPPEQILRALVDLNIQPVTLCEQGVMEEFLLASEAISQDLLIKTDEEGMAYDLSEALSVNESTMFPIVVETPEEQSIDPEALTAAVSRIVGGNVRIETETELEPPETEDSLVIDISTSYSETIIPVFNETESDTEEDIGESWYSEKPSDSMAFGDLREKPEIDAQPFVVPRIVNPASDSQSMIANAAIRPESENNPELNIMNTGAAVRVEAGKAADLNEVIRQVMDGIRAESLGGGVSEMKVTLKPETLGEITLKLLSDNGIITARFIAENQTVKEIMESNFNSLRDSLSQQGVVINQLSVSVGERETPGRRLAYQARRAAARVSAV
ncbi:MAG: flagellar hook-length control protein FliK, partial [Clostridiales bacterium]|nr:flagellar hook-length control protein FliK [Clostridiales bacterium]